ncbi:hypothetical protein F5Y11DRAFT_366754 [Daldinia sp. FL1419]|nr:hypothetical protein F5Y11DRAFT_366754 [Daldinia sp. FL1419]
MDFQESFVDSYNQEPDEYARVNGLSADSRFHVSYLLESVQKQGNQLLGNEFVGNASLAQLHIPFLIPRTEQIDDLKLEPPLLLSDPEYDCRELARSIRQLRRADVDLKSVPLEPLNVLNDESLEFPSSSYQYNLKIIKEIQDEKIDISKKALIYLSRMLKDTWTRDKHEELLERFSCQRVLRALALTPPLSPCPQEEEYFVPDNAVCEIPVSSDPSTLLDDDLVKAEAGLFQENDQHPEISLLSDLDSLPVTPSDGLTLLNTGELKIDSIKIEGPLTPINSLPPSSDLAIDVVDMARGIDIDHAFDKESSETIDPERLEVSDRMFGSDIMAVLEEKSKIVKRKIDQERLQAADATARIEIPAMDFSIPEPGWKGTSPNPVLQLAYIRETSESLNVPRWPKNPQVERELRWSPFPSKIAHVSLSEMIADDGTAKSLLDFPDPSKIPTSEDYVWKQPGLAVLQEVDEEEQEPAHVLREQTAIESLLRKRRLELNDLEESTSLAKLADVANIQRTTSSYQASLDEQGQLPSLLLSCNDVSSTSTLLSNYVDFRTAKRQKILKSSFFPSFTRQADVAKTGAALINSPTNRLEETVMQKPMLEKEPVVSAIYPPLPLRFPDIKIIKALTLERGIFSRLDKFCPSIEIIERDFERWNSLIWNLNSVSRSPVASPLAAEADIIVSPAVGIVITTLLKAIQKPRPGQKGLSTIRERVSSVALRYEHLIVLISEGNRIDETARHLTPSECAGYADFVGFATGLDMNLQVYYVGGGNDTLVKWVLSFLARCAIDVSVFKDFLIQEETLWELFLRRAGINAYAAQAILGRLKASEDVPEEQHNRYGLPAFIKMTPVERVQAFLDLMGGERVLNRVNETLEAPWG